ncbi:hypothetical protein BGX33_000296, partial [Mortierella sp. NVP41]
EDLRELQEEKSLVPHHPCLFIFQALFDIFHGKDWAMPQEPIYLTELQRMLFRYVTARLHRFQGLSLVSKKDVYVASSMIAHVDMDDASECFGKHLRQLRGLVLNNTFSTPEPWLLIILDKIRTMSEDEEAGVDARKVHLVATKYLGELAGQELDGVKVDPQATRTLEIVRLLASQCEPDVESKPKPTEAMSVRIWQDVFEVLFKRTAISIVTGETGLAASKEERIQNESHHGGVETSLTPRKADFILKASVTKMGRTTHHDLVNFEHKSISASAGKVSVQLRKSQRHNHAAFREN